MSLATANSLLTGLGECLGVPALKFDEQGYCTFGLDEQVINFECQAEGGTIAIYAWLGVVPEPQRAEAALQIADANYLFYQTQGATLGLNRRAGDAVLAVQVSTAELSVAQFDQILENIVNLAEAWKKRLFEGGDAAASDESSADDSAVGLRA
jgi:hypothetical protein